jgi:Rieske 2Fe-2S family protein
MEKNYNNLAQVADSLLGSWYYDPAIYEKELRNLWTNQWLYVCSEAQLYEPLMYQTFKIGHYSVIVLRDKGGELRAYHNVCRHRGATLCTEAQGKLRNNTLLCPYHNWLFSAQSGELMRAPTTVPDNFDQSAQGLFKVQIQSFRGFIFINLDEKSEWHNEGVFQSCYSPIIEKYPTQEMVVGHIWNKTVDCNWKIYWENFSECYHCPNIHPELSDLVPIFSRRIQNTEDVENWEENYDETDPKMAGGLRKGAETWSADGSAQGHFIVSPEELEGHQYSTTLPTMFLGTYVDHIRTVRILPLSPTTMELSVEWLFKKETLEDPNYDMENVTEFAKLVMEQDAWACEINQKGVMNPRFEKGTLMPEEYIVKEFHDWVRPFID